MCALMGTAAPVDAAAIAITAELSAPKIFRRCARIRSATTTGMTTAAAQTALLTAANGSAHRRR